MGDSTTLGYLSPAPSSLPLDDNALDDLFQGLVVGLTGLDGSLVRPRFQQEPPNLPEVTQTWCAIGVMEFDPDTYGAEVHDPADDSGVGTSTLQTHETISVLASFYGPLAQQTARVFARGLLIKQNRDVIEAAGVKLTAAQKPVKAPQLLKNRWFNRIDVMVDFRRQVDFVYPIRNVIEMVGILNVAGSAGITENLDKEAPNG